MKCEKYINVLLHNDHILRQINEGVIQMIEINKLKIINITRLDITLQYELK